ncbi:MAG: AAA family ATPase [Oscillospiraceae bacterium]|nr:AAA family ATPase [Oscillospiraceae bacterium]
MNIRDAKNQIKNAIRAYLFKNEYGEYEIPTQRQRPVLLMGPPGIGKTAIMEQIAQELGVGLVSYSMTHHTRQSALGLPFITRKTYGGKEYDVSEYTMSEIIATVHDMIQDHGVKEGILFLDEINCVSETLTPVMLQFLQYKVFGRHTVPDGWIVVTAGNPPEYNNSVRQFDIVTLDRLKRIDVEPEFDVWKEYAYRSGVHAAVLTYLEIKKNDFYHVETTVDGKRFVTARGWSDLSDMIRLYEKLDIAVDEDLVGQYLQDARIARDFAVYYDLWNKYRADYQVDAILSGQVDAATRLRAENARFDERLSLLGLLLDRVSAQVRQIDTMEETSQQLLGCFKAIRMELMRPGADAVQVMEKQILLKRAALDTGRKAGNLSPDAQRTLHGTIAALDRIRGDLIRNEIRTAPAAMNTVKAALDDHTADLKTRVDAAGAMLENLFRFCETVFGDGQEITILVTELTVSSYATRFISRHGCESYFAHNKSLLLHQRQKEILAQIDALPLEQTGILS